MKGQREVSTVILLILPLLLVAAGAYLIIGLMEKPFMEKADCLKPIDDGGKGGQALCKLGGCPVTSLGTFKEGSKTGLCCPVGCKEDYEW